MFGVDDAVGIAGFGLGLAGNIMGMGQASKVAEDQKQIAYLQNQADQQRRTAMELNARRGMLQQVRQAQLARSAVTATATAQGGQFGSGLQGAFGSISGGENTNISGISQNLQIGEEMFRLSNLESSYKIDAADRQGKMVMDQGMASMGNSFMGGAKAFGNLLGSYNNFSNWGSLFSGSTG